MKRWLLAVPLIAAVAWAAEIKNITDIYVFQQLFRPWSRTTAQLPTASAWTGYTAYDSTKGALTVSNGSAWVSSGANVLPVVGTTYDFPALSDTNAGASLLCARSWNVTYAGAVLTDGCQASNNFGVDGGAVLPYNTHVTCAVVATNTVAFDACALLNDGGTVDLGDAGYYARVFH